MLKRKALKKMFITTVAIFVIMIMYMIPVTMKPQNALATNADVEYLSDKDKITIYLLNQSDYLVKSSMILTSEKLEDQVREVINAITIDGNKKIPNGLKGVLPDGTKVNTVRLDENNILYLDLNKKFLNVTDITEEKAIESLVFSLYETKEFDGIKLTVDGKNLTEYPNSKESLPEILTKEIGINKVFSIDSIYNVKRVVVYYIDEIEDQKYYVPVTKYVNDERDKINIVIDNLTSQYIYQPNLVSFLNEKTALIDYRIEDDIMTLNFNEYIFAVDSKLLEEVTYTINQSVLDNYEVKKTVLQVNGQDLSSIKK